MMKHIVRLDKSSEAKVEMLGGKGLSLARLIGRGFKIPESWCVLTAAYDEFVAANHLTAQIQMELKRKDLSQCRWEELWDVALRIRNLFIKGQLSSELKSDLKIWFKNCQPGSFLAVRSSSTVEDAGKNSYAGLHDSYIGVASLEELEQKIRLVWASLWSDAALTYRRELSLDVSSKMAVVIQPVICGEVSGVCFSQSPLNHEQAVIEAVYGMNQGLVDGKIEPDRWFLSRASAEIVSVNAVPRKDKIVIDGTLCSREIAIAERDRLPLKNEQVKEVLDLSLASEKFYQQPQDVEWTFSRQELYLLQSRPITAKTEPDPKTNRKAWDLTLKRSFANLCELEEKIEVYLKEMAAEGQALLEKPLTNKSDAELADHYLNCQAKLEKWTAVYWEVFIPFGHGMRLFGQIYNEIVAPDDPYEFITLLQVEKNIAKKRNSAMQELAKLINEEPDMQQGVKQGNFAKLSPAAIAQLKNLVKTYAMPAQLLQLNSNDSFTVNFLQFIAALPHETQQSEVKTQNLIAELETGFLQHYPEGEKRNWAKQLLALGRRSFLLRDDDNVYLQRFKDAFEICREEAKTRLENRPAPAGSETIDALEKLRSSIFPARIERNADSDKKNKSNDKRQMVGQPASPGYCTGIARIIADPQDIFAFKKGEIMVCDAIGPELTFAVPLAAGIVERRGGMLIHGAIIAREYKIPCVTGISEATTIIKNGDKLAIDGYLGLVTVIAALKN